MDAIKERRGCVVCLLVGRVMSLSGSSSSGSRAAAAAASRPLPPVRLFTAAAAGVLFALESKQFGTAKTGATAKIFKKKNVRLRTESSFVDPGPDPHGSALIRLSWIRIRIGNVDLEPDPGALIFTKKNPACSSS
jgi:hypothetical protein